MTVNVCPDECVCGRHRIPACEPGCTCYRHKGKTYQGCYYSMHKKVRTARGSASGHTCTECGNQARHWALIHGQSPIDIASYQPMCVKCHHAYDKIHENPKQGFTGQHTEFTKQKIREAIAGSSRDAKGRLLPVGGAR